MKYRVNWTIDLGEGRTYEEGDEVDLTDEQVKALSGSAVVTPSRFVSDETKKADTERATARKDAEARAERAAAAKFEADKVAADNAAAEKVSLDKIAADKVVAAKAAAEKATAERAAPATHHAAQTEKPPKG